MPFQTSSLAVRTSDGRNVTLLEPLVYVHGDGIITTIPVGSTSDGASTPQLVWSLGFTPFGIGWRAFVLHDYLYRQTWLPRDYCDGALLEALKSLGAMDAQIIYDAVRVGGEMAFNADRAALAEVKSQNENPH